MQMTQQVFIGPRPQEPLTAQFAPPRQTLTPGELSQEFNVSTCVCVCVCLCMLVYVCVYVCWSLCVFMYVGLCVYAYMYCWDETSYWIVWDLTLHVQGVSAGLSFDSLCGCAFEDGSVNSCLLACYFDKIKWYLFDAAVHQNETANKNLMYII